MKQKMGRGMNRYLYKLSVIYQISTKRQDLKSTGNVGIIHDFNNDVIHSEGEFWKYCRKGPQPTFLSTHLKHVIGVVLKHMNEFTNKRPDMYDKKGLSFDADKELTPSHVLHIT